MWQGAFQGKIRVGFNFMSQLPTQKTNKIHNYNNLIAFIQYFFCKASYLARIHLFLDYFNSATRILLSLEPHTHTSLTSVHKSIISVFNEISKWDSPVDVITMGTLLGFLVLSKRTDTFTSWSFSFVIGDIVMKRLQIARQIPNELQTQRKFLFWLSWSIKRCMT